MVRDSLRRPCQADYGLAHRKDGKRGTTLQGGGTAGGLGIDYEFFESSLLPSIVIYGFLGLDPRGAELVISPSLPSQCPEMGIRNLLFRNVKLDIKVTGSTITVEVKDPPLDPVHVVLPGVWRLAGTGEEGSSFTLGKPGVYSFSR